MGKIRAHTNQKREKYVGLLKVWPIKKKSWPIKSLGKVCWPIKKAKSIHAKKLEDQFKENNTREVWKNIQQLTNYKNRSPPAADEDPDLPNKLNQFYARFDTANHFTSPGPPPPPPPPPLLPPAFIIEEDKVRTVFKRSNKRKSAGPDHLSPAVLSYCADQLAPVFMDILTTHYANAQFHNALNSQSSSPSPSLPK